MEHRELDEVSSEEWNDLSRHKTLTCRNHPKAKYLTKNPWIRTLHFVTPDPAFADGSGTGIAGLECPCPFSDLVVVSVEE